MAPIDRDSRTKRVLNVQTYRERKGPQIDQRQKNKRQMNKCTKKERKKERERERERERKKD